MYLISKHGGYSIQSMCFLSLTYSHPWAAGSEGGYVSHWLKQTTGAKTCELYSASVFEAINLHVSLQVTKVKAAKKASVFIVLNGALPPPVIQEGRQTLKQHMLFYLACHNDLHKVMGVGGTLRVKLAGAAVTSAPGRKSPKIAECYNSGLRS